MSRQYDAVIIGAGAAGLVAAKTLEEYKLKTLVIDADDRIGGRLKTEERKGFKLDHGFQVLLSAYPMVQKHLNLEKLNTKAFASGAYCFGTKRRFTVKDVKRHPEALLTMAFSPVGNLLDKWRLNTMRKEIVAKSVEECFTIEEVSTLDYLKHRGFSDRIIQQFFQPFFGGIFLDYELKTSARQFEFIFKMFSEGNAVLPEDGIEAVAEQLRSQLKITEFELNEKVTALEGQVLKLESGEEISAKQIIIASDPSFLLPQISQELSWNQTHQVYFIADHPDDWGKLIGLDIDPESPIGNVAFLSAVQASYAPKGKSLISVSLKSSIKGSQAERSEHIKALIRTKAGVNTSNWSYFHEFKIRKALPVLDGLAYERPFEETRIREGLYLAGDQMLNPSLNAAMLSGEMAAKALILNHQN